MGQRRFFRWLAAMLVGLSAQSLAWADSHTHAQQPANSSGHRSSSAPAPAPAQGYSHQAAPSYGYRAAAPVAGYSYGPRYFSSGYYYTGWGVYPWGYWGYGYYPYYGGPVIAEEVPVAPPSITSSVMLGGMLSSEGAGFDLRLATDGSHWGGNFTFLTLPVADPTDPNSVLVAPYLAAHLTYSILANLHARVRVEGGGSLVSTPSYTYLGPDIGVSGMLELIGPLGIDGSIHWTPIPADIIDADAGLALHFGALALRGGWRIIRLDDTRADVNGGVTLYNGPTASIGLVF